MDAGAEVADAGSRPLDGGGSSSVAMGWTAYFSIPATMFNETLVGAYIRCVR